MDDLYGPGKSPFMAGQPDEISEYFRHLHNNIPSAPKFLNIPLVSSSPPPRRAGSAAVSLFDSATPYHFDPTETERGGISFSGVKEKSYQWAKELRGGISKRTTGVSFENDIGDFSCDSEEPDKAEFGRFRSSSKRSRTAEIHNLSEKRRRSRINEKIKALQTLIPNSSKTDKVSMLDEAIEYLKQLQLKVQMLTMRKGVSSQPMCLQQIQQTTSWLNSDGGNGEFSSCNRFSLNEERPLSIPSSHGSDSNESIILSSMQNGNHSFSFVPRYAIHYTPTTSEEVGRGGTS